MQATMMNRILPVVPRYGLMILIVLLILVEPAMANKFETIGGGVAGSSGIKREWLQNFFLVVGGLSLLSALLAVFVPHNNALYLNFDNWKRSAIVLSVMAAAFFLFAWLI